MAIAPNDFNQPEVIRTFDPITPAKGKTVCYSGVYSGLVCGELVLTGNEVTRANPWSAFHQAEYFFHVGIVGLKALPYVPVFNRAEEDYGAPVFVPEYDQCQEPKQITAAWPVGLLLLSKSVMPLADLANIKAVFNPKGPGIVLPVFVSYFAYQPLNLILDNEPNLRLLISPKNLANNLAKCN
jgi:hypothetical protein